MGLDLVEWLMCVEEEFGVALPDDEAAHWRTMGDVQEWLVSQVCLEPSDGCASSRWFYRLRQALVAEFEVERALVIPDMFVDTLLPTDDRRAAWARLATVLGVALPGLGWAHRSAPESPFRTVRDMVGYLLLTQTPADCRRWRPDEVWSALVALSVEQWDLDPRLIQPESRFGDDLGIS